MKLTPQERDVLRQRCLNDTDVNLDRLIVLTEQTMAKKFEEEIKRAKDKILSMVQDANVSKEIGDLIDKSLLSDSKNVRLI